MTYEQSLKNIEILKNLVLPLEAHQVFFDFRNQTDYEIVLLKTTESDEYKDLIREKFNNTIPVAQIAINKQEYELFHYEDENVRYRYNFTTKEVLMNDIKESFRKKTSVEIAVEMHRLLLKLKNM